jgi:hypothetical protein
MLTLFSTPKPFVGHINVIQSNAIRSWQRLHPDAEIILVGDDEGTAEVCIELGIRHIKDVKKNKYGTKYLASIYDQVQEVARHEILCHVNCDIMLMSDFMGAARSVLKTQERFLMAGQRWDVDIQNPLDFGQPDWERNVRRLASETNRQRPTRWIDYFLFRRGLYYQQIPEFVIGRPGWDNWLLWYPISIQVPVVDASRSVIAVHQNHDYGYHPEGEKGVWYGEEAQENYRLHAGKYATLDNATHILSIHGLKPNHRRWFTQAKRTSVDKFYKLWFGLLDATRPLRRHFGLHKRESNAGMAKNASDK